MAKLYLYQAVDIVTQKEKKVLSFVEGDEQRDVNGFKTFH
jgi:hypothetical protein